MDDKQKMTNLEKYLKLAIFLSLAFMAGHKCALQLPLCQDMNLKLNEIKACLEVGDND